MTNVVSKLRHVIIINLYHELENEISAEGLVMLGWVWSALERTLEMSPSLHRLWTRRKPSEIFDHCNKMATKGSLVFSDEIYWCSCTKSYTSAATVRKRHNWRRGRDGHVPSSIKLGVEITKRTCLFQILSLYLNSSTPALRVDSSVKCLYLHAESMHVVD